MVGLLHLAGKVVYQDVAIAVDLLKEILAKYEADLFDSMVTWGIKRKVIVCGEAHVILFGGSLREGEVILSERCGLVKIVNNGKLDTAAPHVGIPPMGWFKEEEG